jgi:hypothetical protein
MGMPQGALFHHGEYAQKEFSQPLSMPLKNEKERKIHLIGRKQVKIEIAVF